MSSAFIPLHVHSEYSSLDGAILISKYVQWACEHNLPAIAVTDHGMMSSAVPLKRKCDEAGIKPIMGCELYAESFIKTGDSGAKDIYHLLALPLTKKGFQALVKLLSRSHKDNFYKKPRVSWDMMEEFGSEDIFFSTACVQGELSQLVLSGDMQGAVSFVEKMKGLLKQRFAIEMVDAGEDFYVDHGMTQYQLNQKLYDLAGACGVRTVMTTDSHYFSGDRSWYDALLAAQMKTTIDDVGWDAGIDLSLRSPDEMWTRWGNIYPDALQNTADIASMAETFPLALDKPLLPKLKFSVSLRDLAFKEIERKIAGKRNKEEYRERLGMEIDIISRMGYEDYFLMVWDTVNWARQNGIFVGPGRGSAAGSLLAYVLGITQVDPLRHGLLFERFLNPERVSMPDIDLDFEDVHRDRIIEHLKDQYGDNSVIPIANYTRMHLKAALRDAMRVSGYDVGPGSIGDSFVKYVSSALEEEAGEEEKDGEWDLDSLLSAASGFRGIDSGRKEEVLSLTVKLSNRIRNYSKHACGVVIAPPDVTEYAPVYRLNGEIVCQYNMDSIDYLNLIKLDILGLSTLSVVKRAYEQALEFDKSTPSPEDIYEYLNQEYGAVSYKVKMDTVDRAYMLLQDGDSTGVFQMYSPGMRKLLKQLRPDGIDALSVLIALFRPGPLKAKITESFVESHKSSGQQDSGMLFPPSVRRVIRSITKDSNGFPIYQEHVMKIAREVTGYSLGEADLLRRAMGKKKADLMKTMEETFVQKAADKGYPKQDAAETFGVLKHFAGYGFNKSHSMAYAFLAFATAWYKANRSPVFWSALLDSKLRQVKRDSLGTYIREAKGWHKVLPPMIMTRNGSAADSIKDAQYTRVIKDTGGFDLSIEDTWKSGQCWKICLGMHFMKGFAEGKLSKIEALSNDLSSLEDLTEFLALDPLGAEIPPKYIASLFMGGFFDLMFAPQYESFGVKPLTFRAALLKIGAGREFPHGLCDRLYDVFAGFKKGIQRDERWIRDTLRKESEDFFTAVFSLVVSKLRSRTRLKRNIWSEDDVRGYIRGPFRSLVEYILDYARFLSAESKRDKDLTFKLKTLLCAQEHELFGDGI